MARENLIKVALSDDESYMGRQHYSTTQRYLHHKPRREDAAALAEAFRVPNRVPKRPGSAAIERNGAPDSVPTAPDPAGS